jgi:hypothetical protein
MTNTEYKIDEEGNLVKKAPRDFPNFFTFLGIGILLSQVFSEPLLGEPSEPIMFAVGVSIIAISFSKNSS